MTSAAAERPIFVIGAPRSGTTMLRYMLSAHPRIYIPPESNFISRFLTLPPHEPLSPARATQLLHSVLDYAVFFRDWQGERPQPEAFIRALPDSRPGTLLDALYGQYALQHQAQRWGDKSPIYTSHVAEIARLFPTAQFVHIVRDGRDVALSMLKAYQGRRFFYMDLCFAALSWRRRVQSARAAGAPLGSGRYFELHYEQLTAEPEANLRRLCHFLGETFDEAMLAHHQVAEKQYHSTGVHAATRQPLTTRSAGRWRTKMSPSDQRLFQAMAGDLLADLGYERATLGPLTLRERGRLARLRVKYTTIESGRRLLQTVGVVHPAGLMSKVVKSGYGRR